VVRARLEGEQDLHGCMVSGIAAHSDGSINVDGNFDSERSEEIATRVVESSVKVSAGKVSISF
jgi:hypothetical protein